MQATAFWYCVVANVVFAFLNLNLNQCHWHSGCHHGGTQPEAGTDWSNPPPRPSHKDTVPPPLALVGDLTSLIRAHLTTTTMQNSRVYLGPFGHLHCRSRLCPRPAHRMYSIKYYYIRGSTNWYRQPVALEGTSKQVTGNKEKTKGVTQ